MSTGVRPGFSNIADGWGTDDLDMLTERMIALSAYWQENFPLSDPERRIAKAMGKRLCDLGGIEAVEMH